MSIFSALITLFVALFTAWTIMRIVRAVFVVRFMAKLIEENLPLYFELTQKRNKMINQWWRPLTIEEWRN